MKKKGICAGGLLLVLLVGTVLYSIYQKNKPNALEVVNLKTEYSINPIGIDEKNPRFSWQMTSETRGKVQEAYRIVIAKSERKLKYGNYLWDSKKIQESDSISRTVSDILLEPETRYYWKVYVWDEAGDRYVSRETAYFETGLMNNAMGDVSWIASEIKEKEIQAVNDEDYYYTIAADIKPIKARASIIFGYDNNNTFYRVILDRVSNPYITLQTELMENGIFAEDVSFLFSSMEDVSNKYVNLRLEVKKDILSVFLENQPIGEYAIEPRALGRVGVMHDSSYVLGGDAYYDNFLVTDKQGNIIFEEDFEDPEETIFSPEFYEVKEGQLCFDFGVLLTPDKDYEYAAPMFRKEFTTENKKIKQARLYASALGIYDFYVNGQKVSEEYFNPGKLAYSRTITYQTFDITDKVRNGSNAIGAYLGHGWYDKAVGVAAGEPWGDINALAAKLVITYADGTKESFVTDETWKCYKNGPIRQNDIYNGQMYDANYEIDGFSESGLDESNWEEVHAYEAEELKVGRMTATLNPPVKNTEVLKPIQVTEPKKGVFIYDFGQNFTGICRISVKGEKGQKITLRHAEEINTEKLENKDDDIGMIWTFNLLGAHNTDRFVLKGDPKGEVFEPFFVFRGFRYVEVTGMDTALELDEIEGLVLTSDLAETGRLETSDARINRLYENAKWSQKSNFISSPTDCPQRDERHGWTGDAQVFARTASYNADVYWFMDKFLQDMRDIQDENGSYPDMAPRNFHTDENGVGGIGGVNGWGDAGVIITWQMYQQYGDTRIIEKNYEAMSKWIQYLIDTSDNFIRDGGGYGDHLAITETPVDLVNTAWCAYSSDLLSKMAGAIGKKEDAEKYSGIFEAYKKAWNDAYVSQDGMTHCWTESSYVLGLQFNLFEEKDREKAAKHLITCIEANDNHLTTGFAAIGFLNPVLSDMGYDKKAYELLMQDSYPSWLYAVDRGATTIYERWYGKKDTEDGGYSLSGSLNHYAFGSIAEWMYRYMAGIDRKEDAPGFKQILLSPTPDESLSYAKAEYDSVYGTILSEWEQTEAGMKYRFRIPANTSAVLSLPSLQAGNVYLESGQEIENAIGITDMGKEGERQCFALSSGTYEFMEKR